ncbi:GGDEF domain-containing protein [Colwellia sp. 1_MG-2023]|uniref:GGDEF domain-containing protein n=1 Tax=Colwellia sp. 1_MG-2023 TaxID=3062649 RepID=UPI0026E2D1F4|nr:GGDEF domain-containing protein [Colwellia sp. 1_MG-2023]MDO6445741.1 GGDEF domain-containing protein [Colwellia sp. 1_MG-2023]
MFLSNLVNSGSEHLPFSQANKIKTTNIVTLITVIISGLYTLNYIFVLQHPIVALINSLFTLCYLMPLYLNAKYLSKLAKVWFFLTLMLHLLVCTNLYVTNESGFHLYYFLVPTGAYLLFDTKDKKEKLFLSILSIILLIYCENTKNISPLITLSPFTNELIYQSVILFIMLEVIVVLTIFINQIESNEEQLRLQATTDSLTGIANRRYFFEKLNQLIFQEKEYPRPLSILLIDFDHFKQINDKYGHFSGDICLTEICTLTTSLLREQDIFARLGGEEFVIALPETTLQEANQIAERIRLNISEHNIMLPQQPNFNCSVSIGIASNANPDDDLDKILLHADEALYQAKSYGRNRTFAYQVN